MSSPSSESEQVAPVPGAADLVERFAQAWAQMDPDAFTPLFRPDVHLIHPIERDTHGVQQARDFMARTMSLIPDLRYDVQGWASGSDHVIIWGRLYGTIGGGPIEWPLVDRIKLEDGLIRERVAYFDPLVILGTVARRPSAWWPFVRGQLRRLSGGYTHPAGRQDERS
ncbi:nuclear transport factor 2 family protein [Mycolicibacterium wolinskyi]|uniref:nuclear transport factor 2 family protein n=1 Tax=Mycolicibacterium wolinskyi TaxID=59750 RepID=UPI00082F2C7A|nr:nuclear transport factor 2 family protein [Mycolicibacterium wolinskyi]